jgi:cbb3-type cytochrome oxidase subunit 3
MKTCSERISAIREKLEPYRFRYFRILRTIIFYWLFMEGVALSFVSDETMEENPMMGHGTTALSMLIVFVLLAGIFILYDPTARRHFCKAPPKETSVFSEGLFVLRSYEFWAEAVGLLLLPLLFGPGVYAHPLYLIFRHADFDYWQLYFYYVLFVLPVFLMIELSMRVRTRHFWRTLTYEDAMSKHMDAVALAFLSVLIIFGYSLAARIYIAMIALTIGVLLRMSPLVLLALLGIFLICLAFLYTRAFCIRRKFLKRLKKVCRTENITISEMKRPYLSLFTQKRNEFQFTVEMHGKTYACKMIGAMAKNAPMLFCDRDTGYFKFGYQFRGKDIVFWREWFTHSFDAPNADKKIIIVIPAPRLMRAVHMHTLFATDNVTFISEGKGERSLDNASVVYDSTVFSGSGFINALKRDCLDKSADF